MTLDEIRDRVWDALGKPTDLNPDTDTQLNGGPLLTDFANKGQLRIALWQDPITGKRMRLPSLLNSMNYYTTVATDTVSDVDNDTFPYYVDLTSFPTNDDELNDWTIVINSEVRRVMDYDGANQRAYYNEPFNTDPEADDSVTLYKDFDLLMPSTHVWSGYHINLPGTTDAYRADGNLLEVLSITDVTNGVRLVRGLKRENYVSNVTMIGDPTEWFRFGNKIVYDKAVDSNLWMKLEYYRTPLDMTDDTDEPEIPEPWHEAIVLWGVWYGLTRTGEASATQLAWKSLIEFIRSTYGQKEVEDERVYPQGIVKMRW